MPTRELGRNELRAALDEFSRNRQGWRAALEESDPAEGRNEIRDLPLVGISVDDRDGENQVVIMFGDQPDRHITHIVDQPTSVRITQGEGREETVEIESEDGGRTVVHLYANASAASTE